MSSPRYKLFADEQGFFVNEFTKWFKNFFRLKINVSLSLQCIVVILTLNPTENFCISTNTTELTKGQTDGKQVAMYKLL